MRSFQLSDDVLCSLLFFWSGTQFANVDLEHELRSILAISYVELVWKSTRSLYF